MSAPSLRCSFLALHVSLGVVVLSQSLLTVRGALRAGSHEHALIAGSLEAVGAVLFLFPATLRAGGALLLAVFAVAFLFHTLQGDDASTLLVYAAATGFVMVHGSAWSVRPSGHATAR